MYIKSKIKCDSALASMGNNKISQIKNLKLSVYVFIGVYEYLRIRRLLVESANNTIQYRR